MPRRAVPGFRLVARLGGGPLADVFAADPDDGGEAVALKVLKPHAAADPVFRTLFRREARVGLTVRHPHLVAVTAAHVAAAPYFLAMPLLPGVSAKVLARRGPVPGAVAIGRQVAEALAALHAAGFIHGDIKADNVRLTAPGRAVLVDLGFAHEPGELAAAAEVGRMMGTPNYMAPELCRRPVIDTPAADVFGLGIVLFELLTGRLPYPDGTAKEVMRRRRQDGPAVLPPGVWSPGLSAAVATATDPDPARRPTAKVMGQKLTAIQVLAARRKAG